MCMKCWNYLNKVIESCTCTEQLELIHNWVIDTTCKLNITTFTLNNPEILWESKYNQFKHREKLLDD